MTMGNFLHSPRAAVAAALTVGAIAVVVPTGAGAAPVAPCGALGTLVEYELNDRCDFNVAGGDPGDKDVVAGLQQAGLFATTVECANGTVVPIVARPDRLLVTAVDRGQLLEGLRKLQTELGNQFVSSTQLNGRAATVRLAPGTLNDAFLTVGVPRLQGTNYNVDLDYLEPAMPNNSFRPGDDPSEAGAAPIGTGGKGRTVLVLDSPAQPGAHPAEPDVVVSTAGPSATYDVDGNGLLDEDHGHGVFVASLIKRLAPDAAVTLVGINGGQVPRSGRWSPMMFSDSDLVAAMATAFGLSPAGTAVRRTYDVVNLSLGGTGCDGVGARLGLGRFMRDLAKTAGTIGRQPTFVAASGNDGGDIKHFPAAFRDKPTMELAARAIDAAEGVFPSLEGEAVRKLHVDLKARTMAVGSWTEGVRDPFSNCGKWVNAVADGAEETSRYASATTWAIWSGTSFATPKVSAALAGGIDIKDVLMGNGIGAC